MEYYAESSARGSYPETGEEVKATVFIENKPSHIIATMPALPQAIRGKLVRLKVVTQYGGGGGTRLKTPQTSIYPKPLTLCIGCL